MTSSPHSHKSQRASCSSSQGRDDLSPLNASRDYRNNCALPRLSPTFSHLTVSPCWRPLTATQFLSQNSPRRLPSSFMQPPLLLFHRFTMKTVIICELNEEDLEGRWAGAISMRAQTIKRSNNFSGKQSRAKRKPTHRRLARTRSQASPSSYNVYREPFCLAVMKI